MIVLILAAAWLGLVLVAGLVHALVIAPRLGKSGREPVRSARSFDSAQPPAGAAESSRPRHLRLVK